MTRFTYTGEDGTKARLTVPPGYTAPDQIRISLLPTSGSGYTIFALDETLKSITDHNREEALTPDEAPELESTPSPDQLLALAHEHHDTYLANPGKGMPSAILTENYSLLAIAGYMRDLVKLVADPDEGPYDDEEEED